MKRYRNSSYFAFKVLDMDAANEKLKNSPCAGGCKHENLIRRVGPHGPFFNCKLCNANVPENEDGEPASPIGVCRICGSYLYPAVGRSGVIWNACSQFRKHKK